MDVGRNTFCLFEHTAHASAWNYRGRQDMRSQASSGTESNLLRLTGRNEQRAIINSKGVLTNYKIN
jgi:hypothetical protein